MGQPIRQKCQLTCCRVSVTTALCILFVVYRLAEMVVGRLHVQFPLSSTLSLLNLKFKKSFENDCVLEAI